jgi:hypothetical protein
METGAFHRAGVRPALSLFNAPLGGFPGSFNPMKTALSFLLISAVALASGCADTPAPAASTSLTSPTPPRDTPISRPRELLLASVAFSDRYWDESAGLLWSASPDSVGANRRHGVRESTWYALGLLMRQQPDDEARALRILDRVLSLQFDAPGQMWDGTFARSIEEPAPGPGAQEWKNFDPNWRHFIGTTLALILIDFEPRLPAGLPARLENAIRRAVEGELVYGRVEPYHTNIKLMHGFLWSWAGSRFNKPDWVAGGERWATEVATAFAKHQTFDEYNSPTYYGVDLYGLALWRRHGATEKIRSLGAQLEAGLWHDIARFYHSGLKNMCGPYDRAYGMDMRRYASLTGAWMSLALPAELSPLPDPFGPMGHAHDFVCVPTYVALGPQIPADVLASFREFQGERQLERIITPTRTATAWISKDLMLGGELTRLTVGAGLSLNQFHPATAHWRISTSDIGWFVLRECPPIDARASTNRLAITTTPGDSTFRISAPGLDPGKITRDGWQLPNLAVKIETDASGFHVSPGDSFLTVTYRGASRLILTTAYQP